MKWGILFRWSAPWVGVQYLKFERRLAINLLPCVTLWFTREGGIVPKESVQAKQAAVEKAFYLDQLVRLVQASDQLDRARAELVKGVLK